MSVTSIDKDFDNLTFTLVADFDAPVERVWDLWADPRQLERWWGPETWPATMEDFDLTPGGLVTYFLTGPEGEKSRGWWRIGSVNPPRFLEFTDGFRDEDGTPVTDSSLTRVQVQLDARDGGTRMEVRSVFQDREHMDELERLGAMEIFVQSVDQMDALLSASKGAI
jgi:uncharacterized protein YndB with AHSA1/START domain